MVVATTVTWTARADQGQLKPRRSSRSRDYIRRDAGAGAGKTPRYYQRTEPAVPERERDIDGHVSQGAGPHPARHGPRARASIPRQARLAKIIWRLWKSAPEEGTHAASSLPRRNVGSIDQTMAISTIPPVPAACDDQVVAQASTRDLRVSSPRPLPAAHPHGPPEQHQKAYRKFSPVKVLRHP